MIMFADEEEQEEAEEPSVISVVPERRQSLHRIQISTDRDRQAEQEAEADTPREATGCSRGFEEERRPTDRF